MSNSQEHKGIEDSLMFHRFVDIANYCWRTAINWEPFARDTLGRQLVRACDSIGANLAEGDGRYGRADAIHFFIIARASARETRYWLERCIERELVPPDDGRAQIDSLLQAVKSLNALIRYRRTATPGMVKEPLAPYDAGHDLEIDLADHQLNLDPRVARSEAARHKT